MLDAQSARGWERTALRSDHDNSFFKQEARGDTMKLADVAKKHDIPIIIVTGNDAQLLMQRNKDQGLPLPQVIIGSVGTEIWVLTREGKTAPTYIRDPEFDHRLQQHHFDRKAIVTQAQNTITTWNDDKTMQQWQLDFQHPDTEKAFLSGTPTADTQPYKVSFYAFALDSDREKLERQFRTQFPDLHMALCEEIGYNKTITDGQPKKFCIDLLPVEPKAEAIDYVTEQLDIAHGLNVGDSGNDIPLITKTDRSRGDAVLVGGSKPELIEQIIQKGDARKMLGTILEGWYKLPDGRKVFSRQDQSHVAAGSIIEAVKSRLTITQRFVTNPQVKEEINHILEELA